MWRIDQETQSLHVCNSKSNLIETKRSNALLFVHFVAESYFVRNVDMVLGARQLWIFITPIIILLGQSKGSQGLR